MDTTALPATTDDRIAALSRLIRDPNVDPETCTVAIARLRELVARRRASRGDRGRATHYGLGGSVWTSDLVRGTALAQESGTSWVNHHIDITPYTPFGGATWSGLG